MKNGLVALEPERAEHGSLLGGRLGAEDRERRVGVRGEDHVIEPVRSAPAVVDLIRSGSRPNPDDGSSTAGCDRGSRR